MYVLFFIYEQNFIFNFYNEILKFKYWCYNNF